MQDGGFTKLPDEVELHSTSEFSKSKGIKVSSQFNTSLTTVPSPLPSEPGGLNQRDETTKASASSSEVLDLSLKGCRPLDLTSANTKTRESSSERHDSQSLENLGWPTNTNTNSPLSERKSELVSTNNDSQFRVSSMKELYYSYLIILLFLSYCLCLPFSNRSTMLLGAVTM